MTKTLTRHQLRERAFQALLAVEFGSELVDAARFAYLHDVEEEITAEEVATVELPAFLLNLIKGVTDYKSELDTLLTPHLKSGWSLERLTLVDKTILRLGLFEIKFYEETPERVAVNEAIELAKAFSDEQSARFINGVLTQFITE